MLKRFFLNVVSSFVGAWIALVLFGVVAVVVGISILTSVGVSNSSSESIAKNSVLTIELDGVIEERETPVDLDYMSLLQGNMSRPKTLSSLQVAIREAATNKNISAIYLKCKGVSASPATLNVLRQTLKSFKKTGKKIIAYGDSYGMGDYYVASVADSLFMNPAGEVMLQGIGGTNLYLKDLFDKIGVSFQVVKVGTFKSAVEPYIMNEMSEPARAQLDTLYGYLWQDIRTGIASSRKKLTEDAIDSLVSRDFIAIQPATKDLSVGLVDRLVYERSMDDIIAKIVGKDKNKLNFVSPSVMASQSKWGRGYDSKKQIAVLYATGEIVDGGGAATINYEKLVPEITKLADNDKVKGLVLRVNSPGGAVFGSTQIGEALDYFKSTGKTLAVSMGDYAASGGYWISCGADRIFANPLTITGSIGIFGLIPNGAELAKKIGVHPQTVSTNPEANFPTLFYPMNERQLDAMQKYVERGYDQFVNRVAKGRDLPEEEVRRIGEGRVWSAAKANEIGLVDQLGTLEDAIEWVAKKCQIPSNYAVAVYPTLESSMWEMLYEIEGMKNISILEKVVGGDYEGAVVDFAVSLLRQKPIQARMPAIDVRFTETRPIN
ncbi:MAG: signal peptide peptidase SppA [Bacteroides sp.]|nr:signal peptide peptidase SppA [Bacteroides sp.]